MNKLTRTSLSKKLAVLMTVTGVSSLISLPVMAQLNPRPGIFNEPPYNRLQSPPKHDRPNHRPDGRIGERPVPPPAFGARPPKHDRPRHRPDGRIGERPAPPPAFGARPPKHDRPGHRHDGRIGERPAPPPANNPPQAAGGRSYDFQPAPPPPAVLPR